MEDLYTEPRNDGGQPRVATGGRDNGVEPKGHTWLMLLLWRDMDYPPFDETVGSELPSFFLVLYFLFKNV